MEFYHQIDLQTMTLLLCRAVWAEKVPCSDRATLDVQYEIFSETVLPKFLMKNKWHEDRHTVNETIVDIQ